jgi:hypothetical protein
MIETSNLKNNTLNDNTNYVNEVALYNPKILESLLFPLCEGDVHVLKFHFHHDEAFS